MSVFDPDKFMTQAAGTGSTTFEPIPEKEYRAMFEDVVVRALPSGSIVADVNFILNDPEVAKQLGREKLTVKSGIFLDTTPNGGFDMSKGKNLKLNKLRDAVGQNKEGWKLSDLKGAGPLSVIVSHRRDKDNAEIVYPDVKSFGKAR
jgi:hypothetical protein